MGYYQGLAGRLIDTSDTVPGVSQPPAHGDPRRQHGDLPVGARPHPQRSPTCGRPGTTS